MCALHDMAFEWEDAGLNQMENPGRAQPAPGISNLPFHPGVVSVQQDLNVL